VSPAGEEFSLGGVALDVIAATLQVFGYIETVRTVSVVAGVVGLVLLAVGGTAIVRSRRALPADDLADEVSDTAAHVLGAE
jgi:hypothetical protein